MATLKAILFENHVNAGPGIREKSELVEKVKNLADVEREERARAREREREEEEEANMARWREEHRTTVEDVVEIVSSEGPSPLSDDGPILDGPTTPPPASEGGISRVNTPEPATTHDGHDVPRASSNHSPPHKPPRPAERSGICVICQDEDANIVIVDCGYVVTSCFI